MGRRIGKIGLLLLALANLRVSLAAAPAGEEILRRAANAAKRVAYRGTRMMTLWLDSRAEGVECVEYADGHGRFRVEYLAPRAAKGRVIVDDGKVHWQIEPHSRRALRTPVSPLEAEERWDVALLLKNYKVTVDTRQHIIAHRPTYKLTLTPKYPGKPHKTLWVDTQTYLVLKREARHADGSPARSTAFSEIIFNPKTPRSQFEFKPQTGVKRVAAASPSPCKDPQAARTFVGASTRFPQRLPSLGFELRGAFCREEKGKRTVHLLYEDGIATLSVFVDKQTRQVAMKNAKTVSLNGQSAFLKTDHHFAVLRWSARGLRYTVVGDLTVEALLRVGRDLYAGR